MKIHHSLTEESDEFNNRIRQNSGFVQYILEATVGNQVKCIKLGQTLEGLDAPPIPGELGQRVFENVSKSAWQQWLQHQTMLINEHRLSLADVDTRKFLAAEMEKFLFGENQN